MALIRKDSHGLYVKSGGMILRPYFPAGYSHVYDDGSKYGEGENQSAHRKGPKLGKVGDETWFNHGPYRDKESSEECWKIKYDKNLSQEEIEKQKDELKNILNPLTLKFNCIDE